MTTHDSQGLRLEKGDEELELRTQTWTFKAVLLEAVNEGVRKRSAGPM